MYVPIAPRGGDSENPPPCPAILCVGRISVFLHNLGQPQQSVLHPVAQGQLLCQLTMGARAQTAFKSIPADQICGENSLALSYLEEAGLADPGYFFTFLSTSVS